MQLELGFCQLFKKRDNLVLATGFDNGRGRTRELTGLFLIN